MVRIFIFMVSVFSCVPVEGPSKGNNEEISKYEYTKR